MIPLLRLSVLFAGLLSLTTGCDKVQALLAEQHAAPVEANAHGGEGGAPHAAEEHASAGSPNAEHGAAPDDGHEPHKSSGRYNVPFLADTSKDAPEAKVRAFLGEVIADNKTYMSRGFKFFSEFSEGQKPRATVITCSDSRVQNRAWHATAENDDFVIRNIGNQVVTAEGSVEYGLEHLHTPLLLIIGHSGCGAVKAAMGDINALSKPIQKEVRTLTIPAAKPKASPQAALNEGVMANVHNQVAYALKKFGWLVQEGQVTVVGAVYDFRDDFGKGMGKLLIVNVNGNTEENRVNAFSEAVQRASSRKVADWGGAESAVDRVAKKIESLGLPAPEHHAEH